MTDLTNSRKNALNGHAPESISENLDDQFSLSSDDTEDYDESNTTPANNKTTTTQVQRQSSLQSLRFRAQKHLVSRVVNNRQSIKPLIGKKAYTTLKQFECLLKLHMKSTTEVKRLICSIVKTIGKLGVVAKQHNLTDEQLILAHTAKQQFYKIALTCINFVRVDYTYNQSYLSKLLLDCQETLCRCVADTLSSKSVERITYVFKTFHDPTLMDNIFSMTATVEQRKALLELTRSLEAMVAGKRQ